MKDVDDKTGSLLRLINELLSSFFYRDILIYNLIKVELSLMFKARNFMDTSDIKYSFRRSIFVMLYLLREMARSLFKSPTLTLKGHVFVIDHWRQDLINMQLEILQHFQESKVTILTSSHQVYRILKPRFANVYHTNQLQASSIKEFFNSLKMLGKLASTLIVSKIGIRTVLDILSACIIGFRHIDQYYSLLGPDIHSVTTICDAHIHEHAIASVATRNKIRAFTLQHGMIGERYVPVVSDIIFVWGENTRKELILLGVPEDKIVVSGKLGFDDAMRHCIAEEVSIRKQFTSKYGLDANKLIVSYFATNWGPDENRGLFEVFCQALDLDLAGFIKLRPSFSEQQVNDHTLWLRQFDNAQVVPIVIDEDLPELFTAIDVLVTCHSNAAVEAMPFGTVVIVLDIYEHMHLCEILPHYNDVIVVRSARELIECLKSLLADRTRLEYTKECAKMNATKYISNNREHSASELIAEYINVSTSC